MANSLTQAPVPYAHSVERLEDNKARTAKYIDAMMQKLQQITYVDYGHSQRSVHAKSHGLIEATFEVLDNLPDVLAQGLFVKPGNHPAVMRFPPFPAMCWMMVWLCHTVWR